MKKLINSLKIEIETLDDICTKDKNLTNMKNYLNMVEALIGTAREVIKEYENDEAKIRNIRQRRSKKHAS